MKLLFSYTGPIMRDSNGNYYSRTITDKVLSRYFTIADEVHILTRVRNIYSDEELSKFTRIDSKNFYVVESPNLLSAKSYILNLFKATQVITNAIKEVDVLVVRLPSIMGYLAIKIAQKQNKKYITELVGCPWDAYWHHSVKGKIVAPYMWYKAKQSLKNAPYATYVTNSFLQNRYPCKGNTFGCSDVVLPHLEENIVEKRVLKIQKTLESNPIILGTTAATNVHYKGQQFVIEAISKLNKQGYNFEYHLAGGGNNSNLKSIAEKYGVSDKVKFLGSLPHDKVFDYLDAIDIYIQPSITEGLPRALVEAMSRGCPSLGSSVGGIPELLNNDFLFNKGSASDICNLLKKIDSRTMIKEALRNFEKAKEFSGNALDIKRERFYMEFKADFVGNQPL